MPDKQWFDFLNVDLQTPATQLISHQNACAVCSVCGEEIINARELHLDGRILCQTCAHEGYYRVKYV